MRKNLVAALILACVASGCASTDSRDRSPGLGSPLSLDSSRTRSCYGGPVYVPC